MKPQVAVQRTIDATVLEENYRRTPTVLGHRLVDLLRAVTVPAALAVAAVLPLMVMLAAVAAAAGAPHTGLAGEPMGITKYDAKQDPIQWLRCYALSIENAGGNNDTMCLYFPFYLDQAPLTWLESLDKYLIDKLDQLKD
jgi:hypothetical protein